VFNMGKMRPNVYTVLLSEILDGVFCEVIICNVCDEPWSACPHSGKWKWHILCGSDAIEFLLNKLEAI